MRYIQTVLIGTLLLFFLAPMIVDASVSTHKVVPRVVDKTVSGRDIFTQTVTITNLKPYRMTIFPTVNAVAVDGAGDIVELAAPATDDRTRSITSWIEVTQAGTDIDPEETIEIDIRVKVNPNVEPGEYHAFIGFGQGRNRPEVQEKVKNGSVPGVLLRLEVEDDAVEAIKLDQFSVDRFVGDVHNEAIHYVIDNPGETTVVPTGEIILYNTRGYEIGSIPVNPERKSVEPGTSISLRATAPTDGLMGKYKAFLNVNYGTSQIASVYDTAFFYVVPWYQLLIFFVCLIIFGVFITYRLHRRYNPNSHTEEVQYVPLHVYEGVSDEIDHDINLKQ